MKGVRFNKRFHDKLTIVFDDIPKYILEMTGASI